MVSVQNVKNKMELLMNTQAKPKFAYLNIFLFLVLAMLWSGAFINIKIVVDALPPLFSAMTRVTVSLIALMILFSIRRKKIFSFSPKLWTSWVAGLFTQGLPFAFLFYGEKFIAPALASIINSTVSFWSLVLGTLIFRDYSQWTPLKLIGLLLGFGGIALIFMPMLQDGNNSMIAVLSIIAMSISYALGGLINQHVIFKNQTISFEMNLFQQNIASVLFLFLVSLSLESWPSINSLINVKVILAFLYLGVMATALAWMIYFYLIKQWCAVSASSVMYLVPVLAILWDYLFLHLIPSTNELWGAAAILCGVTLIQWVRKKPIQE